jgi:2-polyprenyl-3-methyl-5-hydroxy-6-metoxy-1,4-benzoquinol methylase
MNPYDNYIHTALGNGAQSKQKIALFRKNYQQYLSKDKSIRILDIGPGKGEMLTMLSESGYSNIEAIDISKSVVDYIQLLGYKVTLATDLCEFLKANQNSFALITMCDVLEHIPKNQTIMIIEAIKDALTEDGTVIIQVPNMQSIVANIFRYDDFTHEMGYTERSLIQALSIASFKQIQCYGFEMLGNTLFAKIHYFIRSLLWFCIITVRKINGYMPHKILHPVFFAIVKK